MIFTDEEQQKAYHELGALIQQVALIFEGFCFEANSYVHLIDIIGPHKISVMVTVHPNDLESLEHRMNSIFPRKDEKFTCELASKMNGLFILYAESGLALTTLC